MTKENIICHNKGSWERSGTNFNGNPFRSPCDMINSTKGIPDFWLYDFSVTTENKIIFKWETNSWNEDLYYKPNTVFLNQYLNCHPDKPSMIIVEDESYNTVLKIGIPVETTFLGSDKSSFEVIIFCLMTISFFYFMFKICFCNRNSSFFEGFLLAILLDSDSNRSRHDGWSND